MQSGWAKTHTRNITLHGFSLAKGAKRPHVRFVQMLLKISKQYISIFGIYRVSAWRKALSTHNIRWVTL